MPMPTGASDPGKSAALNLVPDNVDENVEWKLEDDTSDATDDDAAADDETGDVSADEDVGGEDSLPEAAAWCATLAAAAPAL